MESIEASVAYKKSPQKQPQKPTSQPEVKKPEGVSHDEKKPVTGCKLDADCHAGEKCKDGKCIDKTDKPAKVDPKDPFKGIERHDDDNEAGKPTTKPGDFNGDQFGFYRSGKGDPYWQKLALEIHKAWEVLDDLGRQKVARPPGAFTSRLMARSPTSSSGDKSGNDVLDDSVQRALDTVKKSA